MNIDVTPETERIVREELNQGHFRSVDELIVEGVRAWHERGPSRDPKTLTVQEFNSWMEELTARSQGNPALPGETFPREMIYMDHD
jgi:Arc/MetJ-type ribon-helix-helix transcriptional regulator